MAHISSNNKSQRKRPFTSILRYEWKLFQKHKLQIGLNTFMGAFLVVLDLSFVWASKLSIDIATHQVTDITLEFAFAVIIGIMALRIVLGLILRWIRATLGVKAQNNTRKQIFAHLLKSKWNALRAYHTGNLTNRLERDVADIVNFTTESLPAFITTTLQFVGAALFLFHMNSTLAFVIIVVLPFFVLVSKLYVKRLRNLTREIRDNDSRIQAILQESLLHALVVKALGKTSLFLERLTQQQTTLYDSIIIRTRYSSLSSAILNTGFAIGYLIAFIGGTIYLHEGLITYGALLAFIQLVGQIQNPIRNLSKFIPIFIAAFTALERLMELEDIPEEEQSTPIKLSNPIYIEFQNITFSYSTEAKYVFRDFCYKIPAASIVAIVGETGTGKTTLIKLMLALSTPLQGAVLFKDSLGHTYNAAPRLRCNFSYVPQGNTLFSGTIRSNLLLGNPDASEADMRNALHTAAADFALALPDGLETSCGESGEGLSEGQAQRIAIARSLLTNGSVFIFDEATSSLDASTEQTVLQNIVNQYQDRTLIFITHRPAVLKYATHVLQL